MKAAESNQSALVDQFEKQISASAKSIYGNAIGADSFTYLLIVFAAVFLIIMVAPYFYSDKVALNLLKAEFLLQFYCVCSNSGNNYTRDRQINSARSASCTSRRDIRLCFRSAREDSDYTLRQMIKGR